MEADGMKRPLFPRSIRRSGGLAIVVTLTFGWVTGASSALAAPGKWTPTTGSMGFPRAFHTATLRSNGKVLIAGGYSTINYLVSAELYAPRFTSTRVQIDFDGDGKTELAVWRSSR